MLVWPRAPVIFVLPSQRNNCDWEILQRHLHASAFASRNPKDTGSDDASRSFMLHALSCFMLFHASLTSSDFALLFCDMSAADVDASMRQKSALVPCGVSKNSVHRSWAFLFMSLEDQIPSSSSRWLDGYTMTSNQLTIGSVVESLRALGRLNTPAE